MFTNLTGAINQGKEGSASLFSGRREENLERFKVALRTALSGYARRERLGRV
jgi:hypothetical protein